MQIDFDPNKDQLNLAKHGLSLALAAELDWEDALVWIDDRDDYGEMRMIALAEDRGPVLRGVRGPRSRQKDHQPQTGQST